eukprot:NODE_3275_length_576_cov_792.747628_g2759_i0.p3 GENE.NODE_3275_length_576_cov_792.747628_g2759_i0~~NODE_3275_length_576_cov_792.747628_g2759_i0.p3  ORF type:complete len:55 (+),score=7.49 NODE_3275_length_576_cov_792.747628_g2759_i0:49-213(+)
MVKFLKPGKVILMLSGAHAGKKAVIIHNSDSGFVYGFADGLHQETRNGHMHTVW